MLDQEQIDYWFGPPQQLLTTMPGVFVEMPLCKVCGSAVGMGEEDHDALARHIRWHTFGHTQTRPGPETRREDEESNGHDDEGHGG